MIDPAPAASRPRRRGLRALACLSWLVLGASQASALPRVQIDPWQGFLLVQAAKPGQPPDPERQTQANRQVPFAELNEVLAATQAKLDELYEAAASMAERRKDAEALKQENERLAAELEQANDGRAELETASERAGARIVELTNASDAAARKAAGLDEELAGARRQSAELEERLARADTGREAAVASAEKSRTEMQAQLQAATDAAERSGAELATLRQELERTGQELATAERGREQAASRAGAMEQAAGRSGAEAERLNRELGEAKAQLGQAATAAAEAQQLRREAESARADLVAARSELDRFKTANRELEQQVASLNAESKSAMETARQTLIVMEEKIEELNAAIVGAGFAQNAAADKGSAGTGSPSGIAQAAPPEPGDKAGAEQRAEISAQGPATPPGQGDGSGLSRFEANVQYLNSRALEVAGADLFSGIKAAGEGVVHVSTTQAWRNIPPAGQRSYLNSLFDLWTVAQQGSGPAVVRIVDASGRVLLEKSGTAKDGDSD